jgi:hypothetical protein
VIVKTTHLEERKVIIITYCNSSSRRSEAPSEAAEYDKKNAISYPHDKKEVK